MSTLQFPDAVAALGRETVLFLPTVANKKAITLAEVAAAGAIYLTCAIRGFNPTAEQAKTKKYRLCSKQGFDVLGRVDWTIERPTFINDPQADDDDPGYAHKSLVDGTRGYILRRQGLDSDPENFEPFAAGQLYDLFPVQFGVRVPLPVAPEEEGQEFEYGQELAVTGQRVEGKLVASA